MKQKPGIMGTWRAWWPFIAVAVAAWAVFAALLFIAVRSCSAQESKLTAWMPHLNQPFVTDTLATLVGRRIVFWSGTRSVGSDGRMGEAEYVRPDTILLGAVPDSVSPEYVLAHEVGHMWADIHRADTAVVNILLMHDAQERIGGYAAVRVGEHAAEAFAYAVLILRMPESERAAMMERVERYVLGTTLVYERIKAQLGR